jgi:enoyl-CoA hydratase/carnithine racemase
MIFPPAMTDQLFKTIAFSMKNGIGHIELNQPPSNHMTVGFFMELERLVYDLKERQDLKGIVISGKGRHYSSGAHLGELLGLVQNGRHFHPSGTSTSMEIFLEENYRTFLFFEEVRIPVISAIRGVCIGSALELALFSHFRFCGEDAVLGLPEATYNLMPGIGGISRLTHLSGISRTLQLVLRGNTFDAAEALSNKLVDRIIPKKTVVERAITFAEQVADGYRRDLKPYYLKKFLPDEN